MSNKVKIILIIIFISIIFILEILIGNYIDKTVYEMNKLIENLKVSLSQKNYDESIKKSKELKDMWEKYETKFGFFYDHKEIEELSSKVAVINENTGNSEYKLALEDSIETKYILEHVKDKLKLKFSNIF